MLDSILHLHALYNSIVSTDFHYRIFRWMTKVVIENSKWWFNFHTYIVPLLASVVRSFLTSQFQPILFFICPIFSEAEEKDSTIDTAEFVMQNGTFQWVQWRTYYTSLYMIDRRHVMEIVVMIIRKDHSMFRISHSIRTRCVREYFFSRVQVRPLCWKEVQCIGFFLYYLSRVSVEWIWIYFVPSCSFRFQF